MYGGHVEADVHAMLVSLGPGGTRELAERALTVVYATVAERERAWLDSTEKVLGRLELGGLAEVCRLLGETRQTVGHWIAGRRRPPSKNTPPFPSPLVTLDATPVWNLQDVRGWAFDVGLQIVDNPVDNSSKDS